MTNRFRTQAEYYLRLAELADGPEDKARLMSMACSWHRLAQELDLRQPKPPQDTPDRCAA
jgi:hypothetical protein